MMSRRTLGWVTPTAFIIVAVVVSVCAAPLAQGADGEAELNNALTLFAEGNYEAAVAEFEKLFRAAPTDDTILDLLDRTHYQLIYRMVANDNPRIAGIGRRLMKLSRSAVQRRISDASAIKEKVDEYLSAESAQDRLRLRIEISRGVGRNAVPYLVARLGSTDLKLRTDAELLVAEIGLDAIPVLATAAGHPDPLVRGSVARLLGSRNIRHPFVAATLATLAQSDEDSTVQQQAQQSLNTLLGEYGGSELAAATYHYRNARQLYLHPTQSPFSNPYYQPTIYHLESDSGQITEERVAPFQMAERMAEQSLERALELKPDDEAVWAMVACVDALQLRTYELAVEAFSDDDPDLREILDSQRRLMEFKRFPRLLAMQKEALYGAVDLALNDGNNEVAAELLKVLHRARHQGPAPQAVANALKESPSRTVRVHAAMVLADGHSADLAPETASLVVSVLGEAVVNSGIRTAHKVMGKPENVNRFDNLFQATHLDSYSNSSDVESGIARAGRIPPDLLVIDDEARSTVADDDISPVNFFIRQIRANSRTREVPIVVVVPPSRLTDAQGLYEDSEAKVKVVSSDINPLAFRQSVLEHFFEDSTDAKARALGLAVLASETLERVSAGAMPQLPLSEAVEPLSKVIASRDDSVRIPCLRVLGNIGDQRVLGSIAQLFVATENSVELREAAILAVGRILETGSAPPPAPVLKIIVDGMAETNLRLREASHIVFSSAGVTGRDAVVQLFEAGLDVEGAIDEGAMEEEADTGDDEEGEEDDGSNEEENEEESDEV